MLFAQTSIWDSFLEALSYFTGLAKIICYSRFQKKKEIGNIGPLGTACWKKWWMSSAFLSKVSCNFADSSQLWGFSRIASPSYICETCLGGASVIIHAADTVMLQWQHLNPIVG